MLKRDCQLGKEAIAIIYSSDEDLVSGEDLDGDNAKEEKEEGGGEDMAKQGGVETNKRHVSTIIP
jgi:hypothetical protein